MGLTEWFDRDLVLETASPKLDRKLTNQSGGDDENDDDQDEDFASSFQICCKIRK